MDSNDKNEKLEKMLELELARVVLINLDLKAADWPAMDRVLTQALNELNALREKIAATDNQACIEFSVPGIRIAIDPRAPDYGQFGGGMGIALPQMRLPHRP